MNATRTLAGLAMMATLFLIAGSRLGAFAQAPATGQDAGAAKGPKSHRRNTTPSRRARPRKFLRPLSSVRMILSRSIQIRISSFTSIRFTIALTRSSRILKR